MFKYTICFIRRNDPFLLLNRYKPPEMGKWNGVGGKIEANETKEKSVIRETFEETGIQLKAVRFAGNVIFKDTESVDGMYVFLADLPSKTPFETPIKTAEGILDWKDIKWILDDANQGIAENLKLYMPKLMNGHHNLEHTFTYHKNHLIDYTVSEIIGKI